MHLEERGTPGALSAGNVWGLQDKVLGSSMFLESPWMHLEVGARAMCLLSPRYPGGGGGGGRKQNLVPGANLTHSRCYCFWLCWVAPPSGPVTNYIHSLCLGWAGIHPLLTCSDRGTSESKCRLSSLSSSQGCSITPEFWSPANT